MSRLANNAGAQSLRRGTIEAMVKPAKLVAVPKVDDPDGPMDTREFLTYLGDGDDTAELSQMLRSILQRRHALARYERRTAS